MGPTNVYEAAPGTIRGDYANNMTENIIHGSDSEKTATIEIKRFLDNSFFNPLKGSSVIFALSANLIITFPYNKLVF